SNARHTRLINSTTNCVYCCLERYNKKTGTADYFGREVSYYSGYDSGGSWSEGSTVDRVTIPSVPSGRYYLRVQPELGTDNLVPLSFVLIVQRDMPALARFFVVFGLLAVPPLLAAFRYPALLPMRWRERDHAPSTS